MKKLNRLFYFVCFFIGIFFVSYIQPQISTAAPLGGGGYITVVKFGSIEGTSIVTGYEGWSVIKGINMGIFDPDLSIPAQDQNEVRFEGLEIIKDIEADSLQIALLAVTNGFFGPDEVKIVTVKIGDLILPIHEITLKTTYIQSIGSGKKYTDDPLQEIITLIPDAMDWKYNTYDGRGIPTGSYNYTLTFVK